ncbi:CYTH and CHAD domain-containing protein [Mycobacterium sp. CVI_P3]|uniref:CYTH and CHAD domain-containing protein n=1 Tax=Mycobacterium pinniadriaticum TaxID=2994102 RepID=A0ABT3SIW6_9MYCO|nr:CYTH and CHAD domain-containing protein [Mycobacterium pinniadriaticum]MCX2932664.1 CYTH and CHAD domain-containing protein [Mycobacterium pinniadriaticum]MCX2939088.1 CYTH and CHAD domain-containing protein [Mycobacterium pinniadriaticum]
MGSGNRHVEVEKKFDVPAGTVFPSFDGLAAVARVERQPAQSLDAVYFDTPGRDLAAHRITLRRRTGGPDAGWHLKLPAGPDARTEVHAPLDTSAEAGEATVPADLLDIVLAIVRNRPLAPVARIATARNVVMLYGGDGAALAEFCDDEVSAWALDPGDGGTGEEQRWHEWELELVDGEMDGATDLLQRLGNRLLDAGAVPAGHGSKLAKVLDTAATAPEEPEVSSDPVHQAVAEQVEQLLVWDRAVRADTYDSVHQMRVITRKIRSLLQASEESFGLTDDAWILDELRQLAAVLGVARDAEVLAERYEAALKGLPSELVRGPVYERLVEGAQRGYQSGLRRSLSAMRSARYFRLLDALEELVATQPPEAAPGEEPAPVSIDSAYRRVRKAAKNAAAATEHRDEALHRIRKGAKRLRYVAAATGEPKVSDRAKTIQTLLGDHQDSVVARAHLAQQSLAAYAAGEDTFTYGLLYQLEDDLANRCREQLDDALSALRKAFKKAH